MISYKLIKKLRKIICCILHFVSPILLANNPVSFVILYISFSLNRKIPLIDNAFFVSGDFNIDALLADKPGFVVKCLNKISPKSFKKFFFDYAYYRNNDEIYNKFCALFAKKKDVDILFDKMYLQYFKPGTINEKFVKSMEEISKDLNRKAAKVYFKKPKNSKIKLLYISYLYSPNKIELLRYVHYHDKKIFDITVYSKYKISEIGLQFSGSDVKIIYDEKDLLKNTYDVLIDCNGLMSRDCMLHTTSKRLARIQISGFNDLLYYENPNIDYILSYKYLSEPITDNKDKYLILDDKCALSILPQSNSEIRKAIPWERNKYITFGVVDPSHKISNRMIRLWVEIMKQAPDSKIEFIHAQFKNSYYRKSILSKFKSYGINAERINFVFNYANYLDKLENVDLLFHSYPIPGGRTILETLSKGYFSISLEKEFVYSRIPSLMYKALGLNDLIARSESDYIQKYLYFVENPAEIKKYGNEIVQSIHTNADDNMMLMASSIEAKIKRVVSEIDTR